MVGVDFTGVTGAFFFVLSSSDESESDDESFFFLFERFAGGGTAAFLTTDVPLATDEMGKIMKTRREKLTFSWR